MSSQIVTTLPKTYDVLVIGGGNAALCAAMSARETGASVLHAGTALDAEGRLVASGGRVLGIVGRGPSVTEAAALSYAAIKRISFADGFCRADIGWREIMRERESH